MRKIAIVRRACVEQYKTNIRNGKTQINDFKGIECSVANIVVREMYDGDVARWLLIVNNMGAQNPGVFEYMLKHRTLFIKDLEKRF